MSFVAQWRAAHWDVWPQRKSSPAGSGSTEPTEEQAFSSSPGHPGPIWGQWKIYREIYKNVVEKNLVFTRQVETSAVWFLQTMGLSFSHEIRQCVRPTVFSHTQL